MLKFYSEFPEIRIPEVLQGEGWIDESWHNDATANSAKFITNAYDLVVWVWDDDVNEREFPEAKKYEITISNDGEFTFYLEYADTEDELKVEIDKAIEHIKNMEG